MSHRTPYLRTGIILPAKAKAKVLDDRLGMNPKQLRDSKVKYRYVMAANRKAIYQPRLKFRHWLETQKAIELPNGLFIATIESKLPSFEENPKERAKYEAKYRFTLNTFYNGNKMKYLKHDWDARKAHKA
ncbi:hypothetical protein BGZ46_010727 [Entomortierella lignicola]|nr:hypothetical protein BGZ46_010727 [Entomortierella lignicola]